MTHPSTPAAAVREAFEQWARPNGYATGRHSAAGSYTNHCTQDVWLAWQAAATREAALIAQCDQLRAALLELARDVEDLKRPVHMDNPDSPQAARNSLYMSIAAKARAALSAPAVEGE